MGILCHPWCSIHVFPFWSVSDELFPSVPPLPPKSQCWAWLILSCSACSTGGVWCSEGAGLQALHVGFRVSWKRRRKISSLMHGCPSQGTALAARCEGCPLPNFFIFYVFFSLCHCHFAFFSFFSDPFWEGSSRRNKKWLMKYKGRRLHTQIHRVGPPFCLQGFLLHEHLLQTNLQNSPVQA